MTQPQYCFDNQIVKRTTLPKWLDDYIFNHLGARYSRCNSDMTVLDWGHSEILSYLGTYFPRSYAESYSIFCQFLNDTDFYQECESVKILDFGCGTGGEIVGIADAFVRCRPDVNKIKVRAVDGNQYALNRFDEIVDEFNRRGKLCIETNLSAVIIDDFYDLNILDVIIDDDYDLIISFKAVCEFVTKQQFEENNAYEYLINFMFPKLSDKGVMFLADVTSRNEVAREWLPNLMDIGIRDAGVPVINRNTGHSQIFSVSHSRKKDDISKIAWRLIAK